MGTSTRGLGIRDCRAVTCAGGSGTTKRTGLTTSASGDTKAKAAGDGAERSRPDDTQQRSVSLCFIGAEWCPAGDADWCDGHESFSTQHAIRAAAVAAPRQSATLPASSATLNNAAEILRIRTTID
ncbi:MAG TPA: hypothetical protein VGF24_09830 [Vicinamibacterales bacterium]